MGTSVSPYSEAARERKGLVYSLNPSQIWAAYDAAPSPNGGNNGPGGVRFLTKIELLKAFKSANGMELDPAAVDALYDSKHPETGELKYPDGKLAYHKFMFEMQLLAPYAGDDNQAGPGGQRGAGPGCLFFASRLSIIIVRYSVVEDQTGSS